MAIKEYKLGQICDVKTGNMNKEDSDENGKFPFFTRSTNILKANKFTIDGNYTIIPGEGIFQPMYTSGKAAVHQRVYFIKANNNFILDKYLYYWWIINSKILYKYAVGTTVKSLRLNNFLNPIIKLIDIKHQQQIIDIIEPFENIKINLINKLEKLNNISNILINKYNKKELMINNCSFIKGKTPTTTDFVNYSKIPFINVSAINNNINKYLDEKKYSSNVNYGDVILSLDGTVGIVNNFIYGYNGYGYKVVSDNYENYKLYYSLKHTINQNIIINNTSGSVIKHASKSKNFLYVFWFENEYLLSICYKYEILIKKQILIVEKIINLLISNYII